MTKFPRSHERAAHHDLNGQQGAGVLIVCPATHRMLLAKRGMDCASPGTWAPFGGMVDPGESPDEAAIREVKEEADIDLVDITPEPIYTTLDSNTGFRFHTYLSVLDEEVIANINDESSGWAWFTPNEVSTFSHMLHPGFRELMEDPGTSRIFALLSGGSIEP